MLFGLKSFSCPVDTLNAHYSWTRVCNTNQVNFTNQTTIFSGSITSTNWNFGDGNTSTISSPSHIYASTGTYLVTLTIYHSSGCNDIYQDSVKVIPAPDAQFTFSPDSGCAANNVHFYNSSTGTGLIYKWYYRDNPSAMEGVGGTSQNPLHPFKNAFGTGYQVNVVKLVVIDIYGCKDSIEKPVTLLQQPSTDYFETGNFQRCASVSGTSSDTARIYNLSNSAQINSYQIDWGDGNGYVPAPTPFDPFNAATHIYNAIGNYPIKIKANGINGCANIYRDTFKVVTIPLPDFSSLPYSAGCTPFEITTINNTQGVTPNTLTFIDWGDGVIDTLPLGTPAGDTLHHTYVTSTCLNGVQTPHNIVLTTKSVCGNPFKSYGPITVFNPPQANFDLQKDTVCIHSPITFRNHSIPNLCASNPRTLFTWDFGDGTPLVPVLAPLGNPVPNIGHIFDTTGTFIVVLRAENNSPTSTGQPGCGSTTDTLRVVVVDTKANYTATRVCYGDTTYFTDLSTAPGGTIISRLWNFGDATTSIQTNPKHKYSKPGVYNVKLTVTGSLGCTDDTLMQVVVDSLPFVNFSYTGKCYLDTTVFTNLSLPNSDSVMSYQWNFGDGNTSTLRNPIHIYTNPGIYNIILTVFNSKGCKKDTTIQLKINSLPIASFYTDTVCIGYQRLFTNNSIAQGGTITNYLWSFGDNTTSILQNPVHLYSGTGTYAVNLSIKDINGCKDDTTKNIYLGPVPDAWFSFDTACFGMPSHFLDSSNTNGVPIGQWEWNFGNNTSGSGASTNVTYSTLTNYNVRLIITNVNGCKDTVYRQITLKPLPKPTFTSTPVCLNDSTYFTDLSQGIGASIVQWNWNFGGGNSSNIQHPVFSFSNSGNNSVNLEITDNKGCKNDTSIQTVVYPLPVAAFTFDTACQGIPSHFTFQQAASAFTINNWNWNFGDGVGSSVLQNPDYLYQNSGIYPVKLNVTDIHGCKNDSIRNVFIPKHPSAFFSFDTVCKGLATSFYDLSLDSGIVISNWKWSFGDGVTSTLQNPQHTYLQAGIYQVTLKITNYFGCSDSIIKIIQVDTLPTAKFTVNTPCFGDSSYFTDASMANPGTITGWNWNFGTGTSSLQNPVYIFSSSGTHPVHLTITDSKGCINDTIIQAKVYPNPAAGFIINPSCLGNNTQFTDTSQAIGGAITNWNWDFGDNTTGLSQNPQHVYNTVATYLIKLKVTDIHGCKDSIQKNFVFDSLPEPHFIFDTVCQEFITSFHNTSISHGSTNTNYFWKFGDGQTSSLENPQHLYASSGVFTVTLKVTNLLGCSDSITQQIVVWQKPVANFSAPPVSFGVTSQFADQTLPLNSATNWNWSFGDGGTSFIQNPIHLYSSSGNYSTTLIVSNIFGCIDTVVKTVIVYPLPQPQFTVQNGCLGDTTHFNNQSVSPGGAIILQTWKFGDNTSSSQTNPNHIYSNAGTYQIWLIVKDINGSIDSIMHPVTIYPRPTAHFTSDTVCYGNITHLNDLSQPALATINTWNWIFGDGGVSSQQNPNHTYTGEGLFQTQLIISDTNSCKDTILYTVWVDSLPKPNFTALTVCFGDSTQFTSTSTNGGYPITSYNWSFGDGNTSIIQNPAHKYLMYSTYQVILQITNAKGCSNDTIKNVLVNKLPKPDFIADTACIGLPTHFTGIFSGPSAIQTWAWNFGDGTPASNQQSPIHAYDYASGILQYNVNLHITDVNGCSSDTLKTINIHPQPIANFTNDTACPGIATNFTNTSSGLATITNWNWNFGNGSGISAFQNPSYTYSSVSTITTYSTRLIVKDIYGCFDTIQKPVYVYPSLNASFIGDTICSGDTVHFTDNSTSPFGAITNWNWDFGNGTNSSTIQNPVFNYSNVLFTTNFISQLIVKDTHGCSDTATSPVLVRPVPVVNFINTSGCYGAQIQFVSQSYSNGAPLTSWNWNFAGTGTSTQQNPTHNFPIFGIFNTVLTVTDGNSCKSSISKPILVDSLPDVNFSFSTNCNSGIFTFTNQTLQYGSIVTNWNWDFGDFNTSSQVNPSHYYGVVDTFIVKLTAINANGCKDSLEKALIVPPPIAPNFFADTVCSGMVSHFNDTLLSPTAPLSAWLWDFGDGGISLLPNPSHQYPNAGNYTVTLQVVDTAGCTESVTKVLPVRAKPVPQFTSSAACPGIPTNFADTNLNIPVITSRFWTFGDGSNSVIHNPTHTYPTFGNYPVTLTLTNQYGCKDSLNKLVVIPQKPKAAFKISNFCQGSPVSLSDSSVYLSASVTSWKWHFGDGDSLMMLSPTAYLPVITHTYNTPGVYQVKQIVSNGLCTDTLKKSITIYPKPLPQFTSTTNCAGDTVSFTNQTIHPVTITNWQWNLGNSVQSTLQNPKQTYAIPGAYYVSLFATDSLGCTGNTINQITVHPRPDANFVISSTCLNDSTLFTNTSNGSGFSIISNNWKFDATNINNITSPKFKFSQAGNHQIRLIIKNQIGCIDTSNQQIFIDSLPVAQFVVSNTCFNSQALFSQTSIPHGSAITSYLWNFGDTSATSNASNPAHTYANPGIYQVKLIVTNLKGCIDTVISPVIIDTLPYVYFTADSVCLGNQTIFINQSHTWNNLTFSSQWDFGDGLFSNQNNPSHLYVAAGTYYAALKITDSHGCTQTYQRQIKVFAPPTALFNAPPVQFPSNMVFSDLSYGNPDPVTQWNWNFGDATATSTVQNPTHNYTLPGFYNVWFIIKDNKGCSDTAIQQVQVYSPILYAGFTASGQCQNVAVTFTDTSYIGPGNSIQSWSWDFGDGSTSTQQNPQHSYAVPGTYIVRLIATAISVADTAFKTINIYHLPHANFINYPACVGEPHTFTDSSYVSIGNIVNWHWDFGNNTTSNQLIHTVVYGNAGHYPVTLTVITDRGCIDSVTRNVTVYPLPLVTFNASPTFGCEGVKIDFTDDATVDSGFIVTHQWIFGDGTTSVTNGNTIQHQYNQAGNYSIQLVVTSNRGCEAQTAQPNMIDVYPYPTASFTPSTTYTDLNDPIVHFQDNSTAATQWLWNFGDGFTDNQSNPYHAYTIAGNFWVTLEVKNQWGCADTTGRNIYIGENDAIYVPNAFTPNGNGLNDEFVPIGQFLNRGVFEFVVYNRWGLEVFISNTPGQGWNGLYRNSGDECQQGVYSWKVTYTDVNGLKKYKFGHVTLVR